MRRKEFINWLIEKGLQFLRKLVKIIGYPIGLLIYVIYQCFYRVISYVKSSFNSKKFEENRLRRIVYKAVGATLHNHSNIFSSYLSKNVAKILTLLLQIISFVTTYAGFTFFLGELNPFAPLLIALVVQGGCYYLLNYTSANKRIGKWRRTILLVVLVSISVVTSYMGIYNTTVSPISEMEDTYYLYKNSAENLINYYEDSILKINISDKDVMKSYNFIVDTYFEAKSKSNELKLLQQGYSDTTQVINVLNNRDGSQSVDSRNITDKKGLKKIANYQSKIHKIEIYKKALKKYISGDKKLKLKNVQAAYNSIISNISNNDVLEKSQKIYNRFQTAIRKVKKLYKILHPKSKQFTLDKYDLELTNVKSKNEIEGKKPILYEVIKNEPEASYTDDKKAEKAETNGRFIKSINTLVVPENLVRAEDTRNNIISYVKGNYKEIDEILDIDKKSKDNEFNTLKHDYKNAYENASNIESTQVSALKSPFVNPNNLGKALFSFVVAVIVDGLSVLLAFALIQKKKSSLYYDDISKYRANREEMVEECFMYICLNNIKEKDADSTISYSESEISHRVAKEMNEIMEAFLKKVRYYYFPDEFNAFGYITEEDIGEFSYEEMRLFITFCNIAMIQAFNQKEIIELINNEFDEKDNKSNDPQANDSLLNKYRTTFGKDGIYYIVSKSLHAWVCENFAELLQNTLLFFDYDNYQCYLDRLIDRR